MASNTALLGRYITACILPQLKLSDTVQGQPQVEPITVVQPSSDYGTRKASWSRQGRNRCPVRNSAFIEDLVGDSQKRIGDILVMFAKEPFAVIFSLEKPYASEAWNAIIFTSIWNPECFLPKADMFPHLFIYLAICVFSREKKWITEIQNAHCTPFSP